MFSPSTEIPSSIRDGSWASPPATRLPPTRSEYQGKLERNYPPKYPRIVLKDSLGNKLDTFTYLQEAIYRAEWNVKNSHEAVLPEEWRLPKAPNPARPDYSRTAPVQANIRSRLKTRRDREQGVSRSQPQPRLNEIDVGDVAFVAESLNQLPKVPSLSFLHHDLLAEPKHYFQIVHQAMVQRRYYAQTDKRERVYNFPGFCTGCRKSGLCYGCERSSEPHYHVDRIMRTGGGFTYHRHDHPIQEHVQKNPSNWKLTFPELSLKHLMKEQESASESLAEEDDFAEKQEEIKIPNQSAQKASNDTGYPVSEEQGIEEESVGTQEEIVKHWAMMRETPLSAESDVRRGKGADKNQNQSRTMQGNMDAISPWKDTKTESKDTIDESLFRGESHTSMGSQEVTIPIDTPEDPNYNTTDKKSGQQFDVPHQNQILENVVEQEDKSESSKKSEHHLIDPLDVQNQTDNDADSEGEEDEDDRRKKNSYNSSSKTREKSHSSGFTGMTGSQKTKTAGATPNSMGDSSSDHRGRREDRSEGSGSSPYSPYSNKRRQPLYKAPPAFKVKHRKNRTTESRSPFSTDRKYDLPTGSGFHVKKSEKKLTEFKEFKHHEGEWKEPEKFTVKKAEKSTTNFWSAPKKKEPKKKERVKREQRPISPDSGLESEKPTGLRRENQPCFLPLIEHKLELSEPVLGGKLVNSLPGSSQLVLPPVSSDKGIGVAMQSRNNKRQMIKDGSFDSTINGHQKDVLSSGASSGFGMKASVQKDDSPVKSLNQMRKPMMREEALPCMEEEKPLEQNFEFQEENDDIFMGNEQNDSSLNKPTVDTPPEEQMAVNDENVIIALKGPDTEFDRKDIMSSIDEEHSLNNVEIEHGMNQDPSVALPHEISNDDDPKVSGTTSSKMNTSARFQKSENEKRTEVKTIGNNEAGSKQREPKKMRQNLAGRDVKKKFERRLKIIHGRRRKERLNEEDGKAWLQLHDNISLEASSMTESLSTSGDLWLNDTEIQSNLSLSESDLKLNPTNQHKNGTCSQHYPQGISSVTAVADPIIPTDSVQELPLKSPAFIEAERVHSPPLQKISSPVDEGISPSLATPIVELPKKERPKKTKKEAPPKKPPSPIRSITPPSPAPVVEEVQVNTQSRDPTPEYVPTPTPKIPDLPPVNIPALPEIIEEKKEKKPKVDTRKAFEPIQVMPKIKDAAPPPPKKSRPPLIMKKSSPKKRVPSAEAPVTTEEIMQMKDPLDFLAKYCIISKDRLPFYERIYRNVVSSQPERYERQHPLSPTTGMPVTEGTSWGKHELGMFHDLILISRGQEPKRPGLSGPEQYLEKICYTLEMLDSKHQQLSGDLHLLETKRIKLLAERAKDLVPDITSVNFKKKEKKSKKKKKKKNKVEQEEPPAKVITSRADITDDVIVSRIDEKLLKKMMKEPAQHQLNCEIERCTEKLANIEDRLIQLEGEKNIIGMYCMELFFDGQNDNNKPPEFRRQQSFLYKTLHPDPDVEMNREELEGALQIVNHNLLTENEFSYMYHILNLTGRRKVNFKLFCVIAALSERITHMDPVIRELLNKEKGWKRDTNDYDTLDVRMNRSKELFQLLDEGDSVPFGNALASSLAVELTAGGLSPELTNYVMSKFNREGKGYVDFLDYVTYVPLFIEIHEKIIKDPLCSKVRIK